MRAIFLVVGLLFAGPAIAQTRSVQDQIVSQLEQQGFSEIELSRTFLGRIRIEAYSDTLVRELVFNPTTGEILRDYWQARDDDKATAPRVMNPDRRRNSTDNRSNANAVSRDRSIGDSGGSDDRNVSDGASNSGSERNDKSDDDKSDDDKSDDDKSDDDKGDSSEENDD